MPGNLAEVFGEDWWSLLLPVYSSFGDGLTFPQVGAHLQDLFFMDLFYLYLLQRFSDDAELGGCGPPPLRQESLGALATIT